MAASAPPPQLASGWGDTKRIRSEEEHNALELKMSGMSLMSSFAAGGTPGLSCSTVSTSSLDGHLRPHPHDSSIDHSAAGSLQKGPGSGPSSPSPETIDMKGFSRPPGLGPVPSPLGPGHSKTSSATSNMLTLTPNSSVDGNSDMYSLGRQQSPFQNSDTGPSMPYLRNDNHRMGDDGGEFGGAPNNFGSFDVAENDNDGLLGLDALRDRAYSSPGPMARSFESAPSLRSHQLPPPHHMDGGGQNNETDHRLLSEGRRRRGVSRDNSGRSSSSARPPLSGGNAAHSPRSMDPTSSHTAAGGDVSLGGLVVPFPGGGTRSGDPSPTRSMQQAQAAADLQGFGAIGRPEFSGNAQEWEPSRRRSIAGTESSVVSRPEFGYMNDPHEYDQQHQVQSSRRRSIGTESGREFYHNYGGGGHHHHGGGDHGGMQHGDYGRHPQMDQAAGHKYGALPSMNSAHLQQQQQQQHQQQQRMQQGPPPQYNQNMGMVPQPRHTRSYSQPGPRPPPPQEHSGSGGESPQMGRYPAPIDNDAGHFSSRDASRYVGGGGGPPSNHGRSLSGDSFRSAGRAQRSASMTHGSASSYEGPGMPTQKRNSQPNLGSNAYYQQPLPSLHPSMHRMENDYEHQRRHTYEQDDLTLLGEHIEVPADHHGGEEGYSRRASTGGYAAEGMRPLPPAEHMNPRYGGYEGAHHLPTAGAALPSPKVVYNVKFKRTQRNFVLGPRINRDLKVGTYVKVEADRGEDLGIVIGKVAGEKYSFTGRTTFRSQSMPSMGDIMPAPAGLGAPGSSDLKCIIRLATHDEVSLLAMKREEEEELLKICTTKVRQRALPMNVVDAEYQFDRHKLTFFFEAEGRIDFRELVRDLFSMYKTRIWMQQLDKNNTTAGGTGVPVPVPSNMMDYGTPIIAPASEFSDTFAMHGMAGGDM